MFKKIIMLPIIGFLSICTAGQIFAMEEVSDTLEIVAATARVGAIKL